MLNIASNLLVDRHVEGILHENFDKPAVAYEPFCASTSLRSESDALSASVSYESAAVQFSEHSYNARRLHPQQSRYGSHTCRSLLPLFQPPNGLQIHLLMIPISNSRKQFFCVHLRSPIQAS